MIRQFFYFALTILFLTSCLCHREEDNSIQFELGTKNDFAEKSKAEFRVDSINKVLVVTMRINNWSAFDFPKDKLSGDTLNYSSFNVEFLSGNKVIPVKEARCQVSLGKNGARYLETKNSLSFRTDTIDLHGFYRMEIKIPYFYFNALPPGNKKSLQVKISQDEFFSKPKFKNIALNNEMKDSISIPDRKKLRLKKMDLILSFGIDIPKIYSSTFICSRIALQSDSAWSPATSDFTLFQSSLPDIYFDLCYPDDFYMHISKTQKSTSEYTIGDTSVFYYYAPSDSVTLGVYDHDNFTRDDIIGYRKFSVSDLMKAYKVPLHFGHVDSFYVRLENISAKN